MTAKPAGQTPIYMEHCGHEPPQSSSQLHGVCIFCYRNRLGAAHRDLAQAEARLREVEKNLDTMTNLNRIHVRQLNDAALAGRGEKEEK